MECWRIQRNAISILPPSNARTSGSTACLTKAQVQAAQRIYTPPQIPNRRRDFPAMERGSELVWETLAGGPKPILLADDYFRYVVFENPNWDFKTLNFSSDVTKALEREGGCSARPIRIAAILRAWRQVDSLSRLDGSTSDAAQQHSLLRARPNGERQDNRRFLPPVHGPGDESLPRRRRFEHLRHADRARTMARTRKSAGHDPRLPLYRRKSRPDAPALPYPQVSRYKGAGSTDDAANFSCVAP